MCNLHRETKVLSMYNMCVFTLCVMVLRTDLTRPKEGTDGQNECAEMSVQMCPVMPVHVSVEMCPAISVHVNMHTHTFVNSQHKMFGKQYIRKFKGEARESFSIVNRKSFLYEPNVIFSVTCIY